MKNTLLILLLCIPLIFSCNKDNKKTNKKTKSKVECKDEACFIGTWDIYVNKDFTGTLIIPEKERKDYGRTIEFNCQDALNHVFLNLLSLTH